MSSPGALALVVPCFNEAKRLDQSAFLQFLAGQPGASLVFVDDGSTDQTRDVLAGLVAQGGGRIVALSLPRNAGKGEAVRVGMLHALDLGAPLVGFWDADLATPLVEVARLAERFAAPQLVACLASRVKLLGAAIERRPSRHALGRIFATAVALTLGLPVYDSQCGAKLFRAGRLLRQALATPFRSRWIFDVELLVRLMHEAETSGVSLQGLCVEVPVRRWADVKGSKVRLKDFAVAPLELLGIVWTWRRNRRR